MSRVVRWLFVQWVGPGHLVYVVTLKWWSLREWRLCKKLTILATWELQEHLRRVGTIPLASLPGFPLDEVPKSETIH